MRHLLLLLLLGFAVTFTSCRDDFEFEPSTGGLEFSRDTVYLDTVFTNVGSSTYTLKVYNRSNKDISIPRIALGQAENSKYRLMVDGVPGKVFNNVELLAKDSMFVFIETTIDYTDYANDNTTFLYTDNIQFTSSNGNQKVELVTLVQDAYFLFPQRNDEGLYEAVRYDSDSNTTEPTYIYGFNLDHADHDDEYHWKNTKPYVIYGYANVPSGETLVVDPGARIHFHADSGLMVRPGARLEVNGSQSSTAALENEVIFEGDRLEPDFHDIPGQWGSVLIMSEADNTINHLTVKNANIGIFAQAPIGDNNTIPKLKINNSQIYNSTNFGLFSIHGNTTGTNLVINNAGQASLSLVQGGTHSFKQCTFANYFNSYNQVPVLMNNYWDVGNVTRYSDMVASFDNCIMYGSGNLGISLEKFVPPTGNDTTIFKSVFNHCLIKLVDTGNQLANNSLYKYETNTTADDTYYNTCVIAKTANNNRPRFEDAPNNKLNLITNDAATPANPGPEGSADPVVAAVVGPDIKGVARSASAPDMGAYESQPAPAE
ncbi:hypothetical protein Q765_16355 [Flavobacterium rivuli WB 3.3-2 = DSM 21788]|uniref:Right handed beta helix domain-containing protein n=1 Tax=Flavobacterium rivuli WB 3.3-2 = DSM 21788 TaxID=1121895 RepID=A0A0A2M1T1_9FLAO|nr:hypothetical protein [Flavobacterium rivuli]KGO85438.1 hypothetical protein Q765_16355 [Flavobacterium rivuli WB 3.3-2 = DSM 21788]